MIGDIGGAHVVHVVPLGSYKKKTREIGVGHQVANDSLLSSASVLFPGLVRIGLEFLLLLLFTVFVLGYPPGSAQRSLLVTYMWSWGCNQGLLHTRQEP